VGPLVQVCRGISNSQLIRSGTSRGTTIPDTSKSCGATHKSSMSVERPKLTASWYADVMKNQHIDAVTVADVDADGSIAVPNRDRTKARKTGEPDILQLTIDELRKQSYFNSTEAEMLFNPTEDETVLDAISTDECYILCT
jgi:hypothetical protein